MTPKIILALMVILLTSGCVTSYQHMSDPRIANDGYDLLCGGIKYEVARLKFRGNVCQNLAPNGGEFALVSIEYVWKGE